LLKSGEKMKRKILIVTFIASLLVFLVADLGIQPTKTMSDKVIVPNDFDSTHDLNGNAIASSGFVRDYWPTAGWRYSTAEEQGMNSTKLEEMMTCIRNENFKFDSVVIVRNGYVILEEYPRPYYSQNTLHLLYSATKSVSSMLIGIALEEGYIDNVQHKLVDFFPNRSIANMDSRKQAITLENVLTMTSGLQWDEWTYGLGDSRNSVTRMVSSPNWVQFVLDQPMASEPGTNWTYNGGGSHLLSAIINETTGINTDLYAKEHIFNPLGITRWYWSTDSQGLTMGFSHLFLRPLDMAKLGFLCLNKGIWDGEQIVPAEWVKASTEAYYQVWPESDVYYGYQWWIRPSIRYYWAWGMAGQTIAVIPDYDMVVVFTGSLAGDDPGGYLINNYILPAAIPPIIVPDDFSTIQEAINNATEGSTILVRAGTYYEHVVVNKTVTLVGEDVSTTIVDGNNTGHVISIISDNVTVTGFTIQRSGNIQMPALEAGICLNHSAGCVVSGNRLIDNGFCGISLLYSQRNTITDNNIARSSWGGIHLLNSSYNVISRNVVDTTYGGINGHASSHYNNFTDNIISNSTHGMFYHDANYNNICRNNISEIAAEGIWLQDQVNYNVVAENNLVNNTVAIRLQGPNYNNILSRNVITGAQYGIKIENYARYTHMAENIIVNNRAGNDSWSAGIRLDSGTDCQLNSNVITNNNYGILLYTSSPRVSIYGNKIISNEFGVRVASGGSNYLNVSGNIVMNNRGYGIGLTGFGGASNYATISGNLIVNNSNGIALGQQSSYNTITRNNISMNDCGLFIEYSTHNVIYHNNIMNNSQQAYVAAESVNTWDDGYPSGGNYWSDYLTRYPDAAENDSSAIWDTSYVVDVSNTDRYPLMGMFSDFKATAEYHVQTICNSSISDFQFNGTAILFNVTGIEGTAGFCRICIPKSLLNATYRVFVNGTEVTSNLLPFSNNTHSYLYFNYTHSTQEIIIIPEFPSSFILPLFIIATLLAIIIHRKKCINVG
jgi:parallel beta-helix repeat protein